MEYIPGIILNEKVTGGALPEQEVLRLGVQLAEGLAAAHEHEVVHCDLKPGNLRVTDDGRLKILDFGLAKLWRPVTATATTESLSETHAMAAGTLPYMAPEQLLGGEIDARTDIHAAGLVLYEMATGRYPFAEVERSQLIGAILHRPPRSPTAVNPRLSLDCASASTSPASQVTAFRPITYWLPKVAMEPVTIALPSSLVKPRRLPCLINVPIPPAPRHFADLATEDFS